MKNNAVQQFLQPEQPPHVVLGVVALPNALVVVDRVATSSVSTWSESCDQHDDQVDGRGLEDLPVQLAIATVYRVRRVLRCR